MGTEIVEKITQYESMLARGIEAATPAARDGSPAAEAAEQCLEMAEAYLADGRHFLEGADHPNALAAFAYGHGWLDAGVRIGILDVPTDDHLFTI